jgi:hypothetical protein
LSIAPWALKEEEDRSEKQAGKSGLDQAKLLVLA